MERISSRQNAVVKRFRDLARTARGVAGDGRGEHASRGGHAAEVLLDGEHLVHEALACDIAVEIAAFSEKQLGNARSPLSRIARDVKKRGGRVLTVNDQVLAAMSPVQHSVGRRRHRPRATGGPARRDVGRHRSAAGRGPRGLAGSR